MTKELLIELGRSGDGITKRSGLAIKRSQVSTALLYDASPDRIREQASVVIGVGELKTRIPQCDTVLFYDDSVEGWGVERIDLHLTTPLEPRADDAAGLAAYDRKVYELVTGLILQINQAGWQRFIGLSRPRLAGADALDPGADPDPAFGIPWDMWQSGSISDLRWQWYQRKAFLRLNYERSRGGPAPQDSISVNVESERLYLTRYDPGQQGDLEAGIRTLRDEVSKMLEQRRRLEAKAAREGRTVLVDWIDPPIGGVLIPKH